MCKPMPYDPEIERLIYGSDIDGDDFIYKEDNEDIPYESAMEP